MPAASYPGRGTTRRLMSRGRLSRAWAVRRRSPNLGRRRRIWRYGADRETIGGPFAGPHFRSPGSGKPTSEAFGAGFGRGRQGQAPRQAPPQAPEALAGPERDRENPSRRGRLKSPKALQAPLPRPRRARERPPLMRSSRGGSPANPERSAAPAQGENDDPQPKNPEARRPDRTLRAGGGTKPKPYPATAAESRSW